MNWRLDIRGQNALQPTGGLAQAGVYRRGKCSGKLNVCVPHELYRTPRLRQAARTLSASGGDSAVDNDERLEKKVQPDNAWTMKWKI